MKGLIIWAYSYCRSTLGFYIGLGNSFQCPYKIIIRNNSNVLREKAGFSNHEFEDENLYFLGEGGNGLDKLEKYRTWNHIFCSYQNDSFFLRLISEAIKNKIRYGIASESPCNMMPPPKRYLKNLYINYILPIKLKSAIKHADFIINFSGDDHHLLRKIGWTESKIINCGYYSPPLPNCMPIKRKSEKNSDFVILLTGMHQWHRSPMLLLKALKILTDQNYNYKCYITQDGPLLKEMKAFCKANSLNGVMFLGFLPLSELVNLYQSCSVYVGCGNFEPWGIRLNDALQCGAPLIVNAGMGGRYLVDKYGCGLIFKKNDYFDLAEKLKLLMTDENVYDEIRDKTFSAAISISPIKMAITICQTIRNNYEGWCL